MTWFASHVFAQPREEVIARFRSGASLAPGLYDVTDLEGHEWYRDGVRHGLPAGGLLVCRELCEPAGYEAEWHEQAAISWSGIEGRPDTQVILPHGYVPGGQGDTPPLGAFASSNVDEECPPIDFLRFLKDISTQTSTVVAFYRCSTWAGDTQAEYAWIFGGEERFYWFGDEQRVSEQTGAGVREITGSDVLRLTLAHMGLALPTPYCALMTRAFDWERYRLAPG